MAVDNSILMQFTADFSQAMRSYKSFMQTVEKGTTTGGATSGLSAQMKSITSYYKAMGTTQGMAKEKMQALSSEVRKLTSQGLDPQSKAVQTLVTGYKKYQAEIIGATKKTDDSTTSLIKQGAAIAAVYKGTQLLMQAMQTGFEFNSMIESSQMAFTVMLKSSTAADELLGKLKALQSQTGIGIAEGADASKQLIAYGFAAGEIVDNLTMLKTIGTAVNAPLKDLAYVYGTLRTQGRAYTRDLMQFAMRGIPIYEALSKTMGVSTKDIKALTEAGKVGFPEVEKAMQSMTEEGGVFYKMLEEGMKTMTGRLNLLEKTWQSSMGGMMEGSQSPIKEFVTSLTQALVDLAPMFKEIGSSVASIIKDLGPGFITSFKAVVTILMGVMKVLELLAKPLGILLNMFATIATLLSGPITAGLAFMAAKAGVGAVTSIGGALASGGGAVAGATSWIGGMATKFAPFVAALGPAALALTAVAVAAIAVKGAYDANKAAELEKTKVAIESARKSEDALAKQFGVGIALQNVLKGDRNLQAMLNPSNPAINSLARRSGVDATMPQAQLNQYMKDNSRILYSTFNAIATETGASFEEVVKAIGDSTPRLREALDFLIQNIATPGTFNNYRNPVATTGGRLLSAAGIPLSDQTDAKFNASAFIPGGLGGIQNTNSQKTVDLLYAKVIKTLPRKAEYDFLVKKFGADSSITKDAGATYFNEAAAEWTKIIESTWLEVVNKDSQGGADVSIWEEDYLKNLYKARENALSGAGGGPGKGKGPTLDPFYDREFMVQVTDSSLDNIKLQHDQTTAAIRDKFKKEEITWDQFLNAMHAENVLSARETTKAKIKEAHEVGILEKQNALIGKQFVSERYYAQRALDTALYNEQMALLQSQFDLTKDPKERAKIAAQMTGATATFNAGKLDDIQVAAMQLQEHMSNWQPVITAAQSAFSELINLQTMADDAMIRSLQKRMDAELLVYANRVSVAQAAGEDTTKLEQEQANRKLELETEMAFEKDKIAKKVFYQNKAIAMASAAMATAQAIVGMLAQSAVMGPFAIPASVGIGLLGAAQVGMIAAQEYPGLANGGTLTSSGATWVGEKGPELLTLPKASTVKPLDSVGGGGITINVSGNTFAGAGSADEFVQYVAKRMTQLKRTGNI